MKIMCFLILFGTVFCSKNSNATNGVCLCAKVDSVCKVLNGQVIQDSLIGKMVKRNTQEIIYSSPDISFSLAHNDTITLFLLDEDKNIIKPIFNKYIAKGHYHIYYSDVNKFLKKYLGTSIYYYILIFTDNKCELKKAIVIK